MIKVLETEICYGNLDWTEMSWGSIARVCKLVILSWDKILHSLTFMVFSGGVH
jgi:hypothetical protein